VNVVVVVYGVVVCVMVIDTSSKVGFRFDVLLTLFVPPILSTLYESKSMNRFVFKVSTETLYSFLCF
jgi:hypothetical protein